MKKRFLSSCLAAVFFILACANQASDDRGDVDKPIAVNGIGLNKTSLTLLVGGTERLVATVSPADATKKTVDWSSGDASKATVDQSGLVKGLAAGTSAVTVVTEDGAYKAACAVTVVQADSVAPAEVTNLKAAAWRTAVSLSWTEPGDADFIKISLTYSPGGATPIEIAKGTASRELTGLSAGTAYAFTMKTVDASGNVSSGLSVTATTISVNGLVGEWLFSGDASDSSGSGQNGTVYEAVLAQDRFGQANRAYSFDGTNDYIKAAADPLPTADRTVSIWFFTNTISSNPGYGVLGYGGNGSYGTTWLMNINSGAFPLTLETQGHNDINQLLYYYSAPPVGAWYHWVITTDSSGMKMYLNGTVVASNATYITGTYTTGAALAIGCIVYPSGTAPFWDSNIGYFAGRLDDVRIYNRALSETEITALYHEGGF